MKKRVICLSEAGWRGVRRFSLLLDHRGTPTSVWINARPKRDVRNIIERKPCIRNYFLPRQIFRPIAYLVVIVSALLGRMKGLVVVRDRTYKALAPFAKLCSAPIFFLEEIDNGFKLFHQGKYLSDPAAALSEHFK